MATEIGGINGERDPKAQHAGDDCNSMSYGALSRSTKYAIAMASAMSGIAENTGEGGMSDAHATLRVNSSFSAWVVVWDGIFYDMRRADALEILSHRAGRALAAS